MINNVQDDCMNSFVQGKISSVVRLIEVTDYDLLAEFCASFPGESRSVAYWRARFLFWWDENPAFTSGFPRGCLLVSGNCIGGLFALIPTCIQFQGAERVAANMSCWRVLPAMRRRSMSMFMALMGYAQAYFVFNTTPTTEVEVILQRVPFVHFAQGIREETVLLTALPEVTFWQRIKMIYHLTVNWSPALRSVMQPIGLMKALKIHIQQMGRLRAASGEGSRCYCPTLPLDSEWDRLWHASRHHYEMTNVRSSKYLNWLLQANPNPKNYYLLAHECGGELVAYGLFRHVSTGHWPDGDSLQAVDLWMLKPDATFLFPLLNFALHFAQGQGISVVRIPHFHPVLAELCQGLGVVWSMSQVWRGYYYPPEGVLPVEADGIYPSFNMGDVGL